MTVKENILAILNYKPFDSLPLIAFGYWRETLEKWCNEGHITNDERDGYFSSGDNSAADKVIMKKLGFDYCWNPDIYAHSGLLPALEEKIISTEPDGSIIKSDETGLIIKVKPGVVSIPAEIGTILTDRKAWEELYLPKMQFHEGRYKDHLKTFFANNNPENLQGLHCGSLIGTMRNYLGVQQLSYLYADDYELFVEIANAFGDISYNNVKAMLEAGVKVDFAHYWEDICFKNGPLVSPSVFEEVFCPYYKKTSELLHQYGVDLISVDCDGWIDALVPLWLKNGVNIMFPIEVGTWEASIAPWREKYGRKLLGVGGMNKNVFSKDRAAVDEEVERLKGLIALGGYIPCPDHRIAPDAEFDLVKYYCEQMHKVKFESYKEL